MKAIIIAILLFFNFSVKFGAPTEEQKIQMLITYVENMKSEKFVRNGSEYSAKDAAKFLRKKLERKKGEVKTAKDFIMKCASISSTSGKPYQIKFSDGKMLTTGEVLNKELARIESCAK